MWTIFRVNVLRAMVSGQYSKDPEGFAQFYSSEYDACIKRGGDMLYGVPVINGNVSGMADIIAKAFKKGMESKGSNFNLLQEIIPSAFEAYWSEVEMAPLPNPLFKPAGWPSTPPAPGAIMNIGPNPIELVKSTAINKAKQKVLEAAEKELEKLTVTINLKEPLQPITIPIYPTAKALLEKKEKDIPNDIKKYINDPKVKPAIERVKKVILKVKEAKKKKPSIGKQFKKAIKIPFPKLPDRKKLIEEAKNKLMEQAIEQIKNALIPPIQETILAPVISAVDTAVQIANSIPNPKPTRQDIKQFVLDTANGVVPKISLPGISIPKIPTKEELQKMVEEKLPTKEELLAMAFDLIRDKIPDIPYINFIPPTIVFSFSTNILINPFINAAKQHLMGVGGTMMVMAQYPPPAPPAPGVLPWVGYIVP